jgi:hypothetical protein
MQTQLDLDDVLIARFLGSRFLGRRYLRYAELEALGLVDNRSSLKLWMDAGHFPRAIKIAGPTGKTLVWHAVEVARLIAQRTAERDTPDSKGAPVLMLERPADFADDPLAADRDEQASEKCLHGTTG